MSSSVKALSLAQEPSQKASQELNLIPKRPAKKRINSYFLWCKERCSLFGHIRKQKGATYSNGEMYQMWKQPPELGVMKKVYKA